MTTGQWQMLYNGGRGAKGIQGFVGFCAFLKWYLILPVSFSVSASPVFLFKASGLISVRGFSIPGWRQATSALFAEW